MMKALSRPLQILVAEDSEADAALMQRAIEKSGVQCVFRRVETAKEMSAALEGQPWDVVIADYRMPKFDGLAALAVVKEHGLDVPFIIVSGHITEDTAVAAMKAGAHDYVMKDRLARLAPAIAREMRDAAVRRAQRGAEADLREEQTFRTTIEASIPSGIAVVGLDGRQSYVNPAFCRMVGWTQAELMNRKPPFAYWPSEERNTIATSLATVVEDVVTLSGLELRFCRKNGERFEALVLVTALKDSFDNLTGWLSSITDITQRKQAEDALRRSHEELELRVRERTSDLSVANGQLKAALAERRRLEHELLEITDKERRRIGLDLHDDLGQKLAGVAFLSKSLEVRLGRRRSKEASEAANLHGLIQETITQTRALSHDMVAMDLQEGDLTAAMKGLILHVKQTFGVSCHFQCDSAAPGLDSNIIGQLYKIAQEAVLNAIKHGKAKRVDIRLEWDGDHFRLLISNDGAALPSDVSAHPGMGLRIMRYRANLIGGTLELKPGERGGSVVVCSLPAPSFHIKAGTARSTTPLEMA